MHVLCHLRLHDIKKLTSILLNTPWKYILCLYLISKLIARSVPVLTFPEKNALFHFLGIYLSVKLLTNQVSAENRHKSICINNTQLNAFYCYSATNSITKLLQFFTKFKRGYSPIIYPLPTLIPSSF